MHECPDTQHRWPTARSPRSRRTLCQVRLQTVEGVLRLSKDRGSLQLQLRANQINESEVTRLLAHFHQTWEALAPRDQARVLELLIERIDYRGKEGQISLTFRPTGIQAIAQKTAV